MRFLPPRLLRHLDDDVTVLDVGASDGRLAHQLALNKPTISITGVDVKLQPDPLIPVSRYDGDRLPYDDNSFDTVTLIDVLHHDEDPKAVLSEAVRVARSRVLIKDHYWVTGLDRLMLTVADYLGNKATGVDLPYNFLRMEEWTAMFDALDVRVAETEAFHYCFWDRIKQVIFVLEPTPPDAPGLGDGTRRTASTAGAPPESTLGHADPAQTDV